MCDIISLNKDIEQYVIQASRSRSSKQFGDKTVPLTFVHTSDIHAVQSVWDRMAEFINHYSDNISFALHTGDYCGGSQKKYIDMYLGTPCKRTVYNCVGNHDCVTGEGGWQLADKASVHNLLFNHTDGWDVSFMDCPYSMSYYKDFNESNLRLIVLDDYYDTWQTRVWLRKLLNDALEKGIHVITAQHEPTDYVGNTYNTAFHTLDDYNSVFKEYERKRINFDFDHRGRVLYEDIIAEFIQNGGNFVCNLAGHDHVDEFGLTAAGVLNVVVQNATTWDALGDTSRVIGTRSEDCFNVVSVDTALGLLKLVRVGANVDHYLRSRTALTFDYINKKVICEK